MREAGQPLPDTVAIAFSNEAPSFSPWIRSIDGVRGEVPITLNVDPNVARKTRSARDMNSADAAYAALLNSRGSTNPFTGGAWKASHVERYRKLNDLSWHHLEDVDTSTYLGTMQLVPEGLNTPIAHEGGRGILDKALGLPFKRPRG